MMNFINPSYTSINTSSQRSVKVFVNSTNLTQASSTEVLGYKVDKNGYFTEEFNEVAGIPKDYKIHSSTMQGLVQSLNSQSFLKSFASLDIAKTAGNAYKILSQVLGEELLSSKDSFSLDEIAKFPQGYEFDSQSMQVGKIYQNEADYERARAGFEYQNKSGAKINSLFAKSGARSYDELFDLSDFDLNSSKYIQDDGTLSKAGLLVAVMSANIYTQEGETTIWGKIQGFDKSLSASEASGFERLLGLNGSNTLELVVDTRAYFSLMSETDMASFKQKYAEFKQANDRALQNLKDDKQEREEFLKNYKDPIMQALDELLARQKELRQKAKEAMLAKIKSVDIKA